MLKHVEVVPDSWFSDDSICLVQLNTHQIQVSDLTAVLASEFKQKTRSSEPPTPPSYTSTNHAPVRGCSS